MTRKLLLTYFITVLLTSVYAQNVYDEIRSNPLVSASNYMAYPGPAQQMLTPAPKGMTPFYVSHYGRHGSRYHNKPSTYNDPYNTLARADSLGKLTATGRDALHRLDRIRHDAENRWGDLTPLGAEQHRAIAQRMYDRFPEVFADHADVNARSTAMGRCILSMEYALAQLLRNNPRLNVHHNATHRDQEYLNFQDKEMAHLKFNKPAMALLDAYAQRRSDYSHLMQTLFSDTAYVRHHVNAAELSTQLLLVAAIMQNTELGREVTLYDLFTTDELYRVWQKGNARWYIGWGAAPVNGGVQPYSQSNLLRQIISDADRCIDSEMPHVTLRFGHETVLLPLLCLLDVNGYGQTISDLEQLEQHGWVNYRVFPMAANLQLVFYRRHPHDRDVRFKVLLNENEATLPLPTDTPPYYKWSDFRAYYLKKLESYEKTFQKKPESYEKK